MTYSYKKNTLVVAGNAAALVLLVVGAVSIARGQLTAVPEEAPELFVTWRAQTYVPPFYQGKALPTAGTEVVFALELLDGGKIADLGQNEIRWFLNGTLAQSGIGLRNVVLIVPHIITGAVEITATVMEYRGGNWDKVIPLPVLAPEIVIDAPYPQNLVERGSTRIFSAIPYFWNIASPTSLNFSWSANGEEITASPTPRERIAISVPDAASSGSDFNLEVRAESATNELDWATASLRLKVK